MPFPTINVDAYPQKYYNYIIGKGLIELIFNKKIVTEQSELFPMRLGMVTDNGLQMRL